ncbi:MAG TPA: PKD domain-containing protein [Cellulomonas sp.]
MTPIPCAGDPVVPLPECGDAATLPDLWERPVPDALPGPWRHIGPSVCAKSADVTPAMVLAAFRRLPLAPSPLVVQPDRGWVLVNKPTVVHADARPQALTTTILGTTVTVTASPTRFAWDFGDGATLTTTDPGRPWPDGTLTHAYPRVGAYRIELTTTWSATYTLAGDSTARAVPGTATTTSTTAPIVVQERRSHLVAGTCTDEPAPGC